MRFCFLVAAFAFSLMLAAPAQVLGATASNCVLPDGLREEVARRYPASQVVKLSDLVDEHDRDLFQKDHGDRCPGLVAVDFYGDGKPTWAFVLVTSDKGKARVKFLVGHRLDDHWKLRLLGSTDDTPVVWSEKAGKYESVYKTKTIHAKNPVVVVCGYESWAIAYAWMGDRVNKVWLSD